MTDLEFEFKRLSESIAGLNESFTLLRNGVEEDSDGCCPTIGVRMHAEDVTRRLARYELLKELEEEKS